MKIHLKQISLCFFALSTLLNAEKIVGTIEPYAKTTIKSGISGIITKINYQISDEVKKGELLIQIKETDYLLEYKMAKVKEELAKVNYNFLKKDYERYNNLLKTNAITKQVHANKKKAFEVAGLESQIATIVKEQSKHKLKKTKIKPRYTSVISNKFVEVGNYVKIGDSLLEVVYDRKLKAVFYILQEDLSSLKKGMEVDLVIPDLNNKNLKGKVHLIAPTITSTNTGYKMEVLLDNNDRELKSNFEIELHLSSSKEG